VGRRKKRNGRLLCVGDEKKECDKADFSSKITKNKTVAPRRAKTEENEKKKNYQKALCKSHSEEGSQGAEQHCIKDASAPSRGKKK